MCSGETSRSIWRPELLIEDPEAYCLTPTYLCMVAGGTSDNDIASSTSGYLLFGLVRLGNSRIQFMTLTDEHKELLRHGIPSYTQYRFPL